MALGLWLAGRVEGCAAGSTLLTAPGRPRAEMKAALRAGLGPREPPGGEEGLGAGRLCRLSGK